MDRREHWDGVYRTRADAQLSWYQERPEPSTTLSGGVLRRARTAIDVGGGQSPLAGALLEIGIPRIAVLDISEAALERGRERLAEVAARGERHGGAGVAVRRPRGSSGPRPTSSRTRRRRSGRSNCGTTGRSSTFSPSRRTGG